MNRAASSRQPEASSHPDEQTYKWAGYILQAGMYVSFGCMLVGLVWWLAVGAPGGVASAKKGLALDKLLPELWAGNPLALLNLGVVLLLVSPAASLLSIILSYALARNWRFTLIASLVGAILAVSIAISVLSR
jgi:hypothetical protein